MLNPHILTPFVTLAQLEPDLKEESRKPEQAEKLLPVSNDDSLDKIQKYNEFIEDITQPTLEESPESEPKIGTLSLSER